MDTSYDAPFYKVLSRNDTGETKAHQGGIVIPRDLSQYFPHLAPALGPTSDEDITADLYEGDEFIATVQARFQSQTWGGTRRPEHRLTRNLRPLIASSHAGDIICFERVNGVTDRFRLTLIRQSSPQYALIREQLGNLNWGIGESEPATADDVAAAIGSVEDEIVQPFTLTEPQESPRLTATQYRVRPEAFRLVVRRAYDCRCAFCEIGLVTPNGRFEVECAHICPRSANGSNDPRNGIALCRTHHWAFDNSLWTLDEDFSIIVPDIVREQESNQSISEAHSRLLHTPENPNLAPAHEALEYHRERTMAAWS